MSASPAAKPLARSQRLKNGRDFLQVRTQGQRLALGCLIANWRLLEAGGRSRLGVITSKRVGGAVVRNRARRLLRESFRQHQHELIQPVELVLVARPSIADKNFAGVERDFLNALRRSGVLKTQP